MATLSELMNEWREVREMILDPEIDEQAIADTLESIEGELEDKADGYAAMMDYLRANVDMIKTEQERLRNRRIVFENRIERMKTKLADMMNETGKRKFETATHSFRIQKNPPKVVIDRPEAVPDRYLIPQEPKVDTKKVAEELKLGALMTWAHLEQGESLRIR